jgi:hypothetical protein
MKITVGFLLTAFGGAIVLTGCGAADEGSPDGGEPLDVSSAALMGDGPTMGQLSGLFDCSHAISINFVTCKACITTATHGTLCTCYDCDRGNGACDNAYRCPVTRSRSGFPESTAHDVPKAAFAP